MGTILATASGQPRKRPRLAANNNPKSYLPSVDRPWPLSLQRAREVYGFTPTALSEVLERCEAFFQEGCSTFPREARRAAKKLPTESADMALKISGLHELPESSDSS